MATNGRREAARAAFLASGKPRSLIDWRTPLGTSSRIIMGIYATDRGHVDLRSEEEKNSIVALLGDFFPEAIDDLRRQHNAPVDFAETIGNRAASFSMGPGGGRELEPFLDPEHAVVFNLIQDTYMKNGVIRLRHIYDAIHTDVRLANAGLPGLYLAGIYAAPRVAKVGETSKLNGRNNSGFRMLYQWTTDSKQSAYILQNELKAILALLAEHQIGQNGDTYTFPPGEDAVAIIRRLVPTLPNFKFLYRQPHTIDPAAAIVARSELKVLRRAA